MIKVLTIFGTRPEAVKMAPLVKELRARPGFACVVCVTAQHRQMLDQTLACFAITPDYDMNLMRRGQTLSGVTSAALTGLEDIILQEKPDIVLVHGDTATTLAGALAAYYQRTPLGHVEAGLRTYDKYAPFPEEMNRQLTDCLADMLFAPTAHSRDNLLAEGKDPAKIYVTGNTEIDALRTTLRPDYNHPLLEACRGRRLLLLTAHRRENLGRPMENIFRAVKRIAGAFPGVTVVYPLHMNPQVREAAGAVLAGEENIRLIEPLDVVDFHNFMAASYLILTDSGAVQESAPALGKPTLVLRDVTERPEGVEAGVLKLVGTEEESIYRAAGELLTDADEYARMSQAQNPYGDGQAAPRIADALAERFGAAAGV